MVIDFEKIEAERILNFKGGEGELLTRNFLDGKCKIMMTCMRPGASSGQHVHVGNCEVVYIIKGTATFNYDGVEETVKAGQAHYCPEGHSHFLMNKTDEDLVYFAIVPEHHVG